MYSSTTIGTILIATCPTIMVYALEISLGSHDAVPLSKDVHVTFGSMQELPSGGI